jgi:hypothetical protein
MITSSWYGVLMKTSSMPGSLSTVYKYQSNTDKWEINNLLTFNWKDKHHSITILGGQTAEG